MTTMWQYQSQPLSIRWEYQSVPQTPTREVNLRALNEAGAAGWELCHVAHDSYLMKRLGLKQEVKPT